MLLVGAYAHVCTYTHTHTYWGESPDAKDCPQFVLSFVQNNGIARRQCKLHLSRFVHVHNLYARASRTPHTQPQPHAALYVTETTDFTQHTPTTGIQDHGWPVNAFQW